MGPVTRLAIGIVTLQVVQVLLGGTAVYFIRRRKQVEPHWSWSRALGVFFLLGLIAAAAAIVPLMLAFSLGANSPLAGIFASSAPLVMVVVYLVGLKRVTGLDVLGTFFLAISIGLACFAATVVLSKIMQVDLLSMQMERSP